MFINDHDALVWSAVSVKVLLQPNIWLASEFRLLVEYPDESEPIKAYLKASSLLYVGLLSDQAINQPS